MTKGQFFSQVNVELGGNSADRKFHPETIFFAGDTVRGSLIPAYIQANGDGALIVFKT